MAAARTAIAILALVAAAAAADPTPVDKPKPAPTPLSGDVRVARVLEARTLIAGAMLVVNHTVRGNLDVGGTLSARAVKARTVKADTLVATTLTSPSGTIIVEGDLLITSQPAPAVDTAAAPAADNATANATANAPANASAAVQKPDDAPAAVRATSFLAEDVVLGGVRQWKLVRHEDFDQGAEGWSLAETSSCAGNAADRFLGGHCNAAAAETRKTFAGLPPHSQVRVTARYHFIDNWQGETAFLKLGESFAWADKHHAPQAPHGLHMCGNAAYPEGRMSAPVDVTVPHSASFLEVAFGSSGRAGEDACHRSFGVDDVMLYVR